ncbi:RLS1 protein [Gonium pectorale]|uniref:RLS1 protein n=1 Tax=Gonium pectorale TaxID=33097 RepID=A0A150GMA2_GONPE|nr:RLS1 protein [Gonium pectorale]|eukprot:KXZ50986.1 RLS1 protein [Gonium pectorale]
MQLDGPAERGLPAGDAGRGSAAVDARAPGRLAASASATAAAAAGHVSPADNGAAELTDQLGEAHRRSLKRTAPEAADTDERLQPVEAEAEAEAVDMRRAGSLEGAAAEDDAPSGADRDGGVDGGVDGEEGAFDMASLPAVLPPPVEVTMPIRVYDGRPGTVKARGANAYYIKGAVCGTFDPSLYMQHKDCIRCNGMMMSRSKFEQTGGSNMAKWYRSIRVLPEMETLGEWLESRGLPIFKGRPRRCPTRPTAAQHMAVGVSRPGAAAVKASSGEASGGSGSACEVAAAVRAGSGAVGSPSFGAMSDEPRRALKRQATGHLGCVQGLSGMMPEAHMQPLTYGNGHGAGHGSGSGSGTQRGLMKPILDQVGPDTAAGDHNRLLLSLQAAAAIRGGGGGSRIAQTVGGEPYGRGSQSQLAPELPQQQHRPRQFLHAMAPQAGLTVSEDVLFPKADEIDGLGGRLDSRDRLAGCAGGLGASANASSLRGDLDDGGGASASLVDALAAVLAARRAAREEQQQEQLEFAGAAVGGGSGGSRRADYSHALEDELGVGPGGAGGMLSRDGRPAMSALQLGRLGNDSGSGGPGGSLGTYPLSRTGDGPGFADVGVGGIRPRRELRLAGGSGYDPDSAALLAGPGVDDEEPGLLLSRQLHPVPMPVARGGGGRLPTRQGGAPGLSSLAKAGSLDGRLDAGGGSNGHAASGGVADLAMLSGGMGESLGVGLGAGNPGADGGQDIDHAALQRELLALGAPTLLSSIQEEQEQLMRRLRLLQRLRQAVLATQQPGGGATGGRSSAGAFEAARAGEGLPGGGLTGHGCAEALRTAARGDVIRGGSGGAVGGGAVVTRGDAAGSGVTNLGSPMGGPLPLASLGRPGRGLGGSEPLALSAHSPDAELPVAMLPATAAAAGRDLRMDLRGPFGRGGSVQAAAARGSPKRDPPVPAVGAGSGDGDALVGPDAAELLLQLFARTRAAAGAADAHTRRGDGLPRGNGVSGGSAAPSGERMGAGAAHPGSGAAHWGIYDDGAARLRGGRGWL